MTEKMEIKSAEELLMKEILEYDCEPPIFDVSVKASSHIEGFSAFVTFRHGHDGGISSLNAHANTPEVALQLLYDEIRIRFYKCPLCNHPMDRMDRSK